MLNTINYKRSEVLSYLEGQCKRMDFCNVCFLVMHWHNQCVIVWLYDWLWLTEWSTHSLMTDRLIDWPLIDWAIKQTLCEYSGDHSRTNTQIIEPYELSWCQLFLSLEAPEVVITISSCVHWKEPSHKSHNALHNASFCNRNVHKCAHFCYKMLHCGTWDWCIVGFVQQVYIG